MDCSVLASCVFLENKKGILDMSHIYASLVRQISTFVIRVLENIISKLATREIPIFWLVSVAEETGLSLALSETLKTDFVMSWPK